jgi:DNA mismatch repair protein MutS
VPENYIRKQTLVNAERYITEELKEKESMILSADERSKAMEHRLFLELRDSVAAKVSAIQEAAAAVAQLDMLIALAEVAITNDYSRPIIRDSDEIKITAGRHPVVENMLEIGFVPNDSYLDRKDSQLVILTGPNMAGKSTYMRQVALIAILSQMGSFVPAEYVELGIVDRIFTRVGAYDDLTRGQSTFMVEMLELANILNTATNRSLIILDEIGRGTSTFDGLSIAWAVCEFIHSNSHLGAKTLFATHYHHLNELEEVLPGVKNFNIAVKEDKDSIIFLYKVKPGGTNRSYGIQVARLAGLPNEVINRAKVILEKIEAENLVGFNGGYDSEKASKSALELEAMVEKNREVLEGESQSITELGPIIAGDELMPSSNIETIGQKQLKLFTPFTNSHPIITELEKIDLKHMTPIQALNKLDELQKKVNYKRKK